MTMYATIKHAKIKSTTKGIAAAHNNRTQQDPKKRENINPKLEKLNRYSGDTVARINAKLPADRRKDAVEAVEVVLSASFEFFDKIEKDREKLSKNPKFNQWVKASEDYLKKEFGSNLVDITLHMDEKTPHLHAMFVPLTPDGRLCAKEMTSRMTLIKRQTDYAAAMSPFGLERGESAEKTQKKSQTIKEFWKKMESVSKIDTIPAVPEKKGILDTSYTDRLHEYAKKARATAQALVQERETHRFLMESVKERNSELVKKEKAFELVQKPALALAKLFKTDFKQLPAVLEAEVARRAPAAPKAAPAPAMDSQTAKIAEYNRTRLGNAVRYAPEPEAEPAPGHDPFAFMTPKP